MDIKWDDLGLVLGVGLLAGAGVVALFALGVTWVATGARAAGMLCFAVCAAAVGYGVYILVPAFH
jgi:hypothetical protein